jgi:hypothetical protein
MNNYENKLCNHHDYGCKGTEFWRIEQQIRAIPEEIALYFDVSQKTRFRALDQQQPVPYQPRCPRTS